MTQNAINDIQFGSLNVVTFTSSGVYTPGPTVRWITVECCGGGGGSAGSAATTAAQRGLLAAGGGGGYARASFPVASLLPNVSVTIGSGGAGGAAGQNNGTAGGATTFLGITCNGGSGGVAVAVGSSVESFGVFGGSASGGDVNINGGNTQTSYYGNPFEISPGGNSILGQISGTGNTASSIAYGGGAGGFWRNGSEAALAGSAGSSGIVIITEYLAS